MISTVRRSALAGLLLMVAASHANAQASVSPTYPSKPIRIISSSPPGGILDVTARQLAEQLTPSLGQPVIVDNKPGAGGAIAMEAVARSEPDGHTVGICNFVSPARYQPEHVQAAPYDPIQGFRTGHLALLRAPSARRPSSLARRLGSGADPTREGEARWLVLRLGGQRDASARVHRAVQSSSPVSILCMCPTREPQ